MRATFSIRTLLLALCAAVALVSPVLGDASGAAIQRADDESDSHVSLGGLGDASAGRRLQTEGRHHRVHHVHSRRSKDRTRRPRGSRKEGHEGKKMKKSHHKEGKKHWKKEGKKHWKKKEGKKHWKKKEGKEGKGTHTPMPGGTGGNGTPGGYGEPPAPVRTPLYKKRIDRFRTALKAQLGGKYDLTTKRGAEKALKKFSKLIARGVDLKSKLKPRGKWTRKASLTLLAARKMRRRAALALKGF